MSPRDRLLAELAADVRAFPQGARVGIDGVDGAGKTHLGDELAAVLGDAVRVRLDDFLNPPAIRYARGRGSPAGFFLDSFDLSAFAGAVHGAPADATVVADGIFLHRDELAGLWDSSIWLDVPFEVSIPRGAARGDGLGSADPGAESNRRYVEGQRLYIRSCSPQARATVVVDNSDLDRPVLVRR